MSKDSKAYQRAVRRNENIKRWRKQQKERLALAVEAQNKERESNLRRMKAKELDKL